MTLMTEVPTRKVQASQGDPLPAAMRAVRINGVTPEA